MTTNRKFKIGAEIAICASDSTYQFWSAKIRLYEVESVPLEDGGGLTDISNSALNPVTFYVNGSSYGFPKMEPYQRKQDLGLDHYGTWRLETDYTSSVEANDAIEAGRRCLALERKGMKLCETYGSPATAAENLKRALLCVKPSFIRIVSSYSGTTIDAQSCWTQARGPNSYDYQIRCEMEKFRFELQAKHPDLLEAVKEEVTV